MIRDPSDGTIKEPPKPTLDVSGLQTDKLKAEELARLERAREWLREWKGRNGT